MARWLALAMLLAGAPGVLASESPGAGASLLRPATPHVRLLTWNITGNAIFDDPGVPATGPAGSPGPGDGGRPARFRRMLQALQPDLLCLQEVFPPRTPDDTARLLDAALPLPDGRQWQAHGQGDIVIASRYPLSQRDGRSRDWGGGRPRAHAMALVDLPEPWDGADLYVVCAHLQSRGEAKDLRARQEQADAIVAWLHDLRSPGGAADLPPRTPIALMGDWNAYRTDPAAHITTLLTGAIANEADHGPGGPPDWDDTPLRDAEPSINGAGQASHTFGDGSASEFPPAALDRVMFTDSVLDLVGGFVLDTTVLPQATLAERGLQADDILLNASPRRYDHLPVVVDLAPSAVHGQLP